MLFIYETLRWILAIFFYGTCEHLIADQIRVLAFKHSQKYHVCLQVVFVVYTISCVEALKIMVKLYEGQ